MADEHIQTENRAEITSNFTSAGNSMKCKLCKDIELQYSHVLNKFSSVRLIVDLSSKQRDRVQSESPSGTATNKQWTLVSYNNRIVPQHIPGTANRFQTLTNLSTDS